MKASIVLLVDLFERFIRAKRLFVTDVYRVSRRVGWPKETENHKILIEEGARWGLNEIL